jgi:hypothetical protein
MCSVSLICTVHDENGRANVSELCAILDFVRPEVIFLEVPPAALEGYVDSRTRQNMESVAVERYRESHQVALVPVDLPTPEAAFFNDNQYLFERIEKASLEYRRLVDAHRAYVATYGFAYLNSDECSNLWSNLYREILDTIGRIGEARLAQLYILWTDTNARRDKGMIHNVRQYCRDNSFARGAFLVGAAHRRSVISEALASCESAGIQWKVDTEWVS